MLAPEGEGVWGDANTVTFAVGAAVAAFVATGLLHLLLLSAPSPASSSAGSWRWRRPSAVLAPFTTDA